MGKSKSKKKTKTKRRKAKKAPRVKGPLWKIWLFKFLKEKMPGEKVRAIISRRGPIAKRLTRRFRR